MTVLSMDNRRQALSLMHVDRIPNLAYPGASGIDNFDVLKKRPNAIQQKHQLSKNDQQ
jgi:hypothetical protein